MTSQRIAITGANRGLGLEFTREWLERGDRVFALVRDPSGARELDALAARHSETLMVLPCDVSDDDSVDQARMAIEASCPALDLVVNNAGVYNKSEGGFPDVDLGSIQQVFNVNTLGPLRVSRALIPWLRKGVRPRLVHVTSKMGSIEDNTSGGSWGYRLSKTALNMVNRNLAVELAAATIPSVVIHPGWVRTDMGGGSAPLSIPESVAEMVSTLDRLTMDQSGSFLDRDGTRIPY